MVEGGIPPSIQESPKPLARERIKAVLGTLFAGSNPDYDRIGSYVINSMIRQSDDKKMLNEINKTGEMPQYLPSHLLPKRSVIDRAKDAWRIGIVIPY